MAVRHWCGLTAMLLGAAAAPGAASAQGLLQGFAAAPAVPYRAASFPPAQEGLFGQPVPPADLYARQGYRQAQFPPEHGRYGGGFVELLMTGDAGSNPVPPAASYPAPAPVAPSYNPRRAALPPGGLPDYAPQPSAYYGGGPNDGRQTLAAYAPPDQGYDPARSEPTLARRAIDPVFERQEVAYAGRERPGTIIIDTPEKFLFLVQPGGRALRYGIGVGRPGFAWSGVKTVSRKAEWPDWTPPREMLLRRPDLPRHMAGGPANPLGARALYLGSSLYRIHGTNEPYTIGTNVSSGCIRMMNEDVVDLYGRVGVGARVIVM